MNYHDRKFSQSTIINMKSTSQRVAKRLKDSRHMCGWAGFKDYFAFTPTEGQGQHEIQAIVGVLLGASQHSSQLDEGEFEGNC